MLQPQPPKDVAEKPKDKFLIQAVVAPVGAASSAIPVSPSERGPRVRGGLVQRRSLTLCSTKRGGGGD